MKIKSNPDESNRVFLQELDSGEIFQTDLDNNLYMVLYSSLDDIDPEDGEVFVVDIQDGELTVFEEGELVMPIIGAFVRGK